MSLHQENVSDKSMKRVLMVEDDVHLGTTVASVLEMNKLNVLYLKGSTYVTDALSKFNPDIVLMDVMLPGDQTGFEIIEEIRQHDNLVPVLFITALDSKETLERAFSFSNADYLSKPFKIQEVLLRINNLLVKYCQYYFMEQCFRIADVCFYPDEQLLTYHDESVRINKCQAAVLNVLCNHMNSFVSRELIVQEVWQLDNCKLKENSLNNTLSTLRKVLSNEPKIEITSVIRLGVRLKITE